MEKAEPEKSPSIEEIIASLKPEEQEAATLRWRQYVELAVEVYEDLLNDPERYARFQEDLARERKRREKKEAGGNRK